MDPTTFLTALLASNLPPWVVLGISGMILARQAWRDWLGHKAAIAHRDFVAAAEPATLAKFPSGSPPPPTKPAGGQLGTIVVLVLLISTVLAGAVARTRLAALKPDCGPCPYPATCTWRGCRGVTEPPPDPPRPAAQKGNEGRKSSELARIAWPAAFPWRREQREDN